MDEPPDSASKPEANEPVMPARPMGECQVEGCSCKRYKPSTNILGDVPCITCGHYGRDHLI